MSELAASGSRARAGARLLRAAGMLGLFTVGLAALFALPVAVVVGHVFVPSAGTWDHLAATVLPEYVSNSLLLMLGVTAGVVLIGVATAWLTVMCRFPGRVVLEWALLLPLAMPAYVIAYAYTDFLQFSGPLQSWLREATGWGPREYWFPEVRSLGGAVVMLALVLYPYVYLLCRAAFLEQSESMLEAARAAGYGPWRTFFRVALPLARPGIAAGTSLALMETLADFGTVAYFGVPTFTTGIYRAWFSLGDPVAAAQLSATLLGFVLAVLVLERASRGRARFYGGARGRPAQRYRLVGPKALGACAACSAPLVLGFLLPAGILLDLALEADYPVFGERFFELVRNTALLAAVTSALAVLFALLVGYGARISRSRTVALANRAAGLGYAVPGAVIAVGILIPVTRIDHAMAELARAGFGSAPGLVLTGSAGALVYAYLVRFFAVALQSVEAGLARVTSSMDDAARSLGLSPARVLVRVHAPLLWRSALTAALLVFVDVAKELPATFVMRPFDFDTLAVRAFNLASDERLGEAAAPALAIVAVGLVPILVLSRLMLRPRPS